jgi:hypothetical protein
MMKKSTMAAAAAAVAWAGSAGAHEFACEKTVEGEIVHVVEHYPATLHFKIVLTNTHPTEPSVAISMRDDLFAALGVGLAPVPFTLDVGQSAEFDAVVTVRNESECMRLSSAQACGGSFDDAFQVLFDGGVAQCAVRLVCTRRDAMGGKGNGR